MGLLLLAAESPLEHVVQHAWWRPGGITLFSNHILMQMVAAALLMLFLPRALRKRAGTDEVGRLVPRGLGNMVELICSALRKNVAEPCLGHHTDRFIGYIWTVFFFILTCNLLGLLPLGPLTGGLGFTHGHGLGGTATGNIWVTATLAVCTLGLVVYNGLSINGLAYIKHFFMGPFPISIMIGILEIVGVFAKTFALTVRLFANMIAGHILLAVLLSFIALSSAALGWLAASPITLVVILGSVAVNMLELFVAFLQAFIFTFLTALFIGQAIHIHHDEHAHEHEPHAKLKEAVNGIIGDAETEGPLAHTHA